jgi:hypothetical protein
MSGLAASGPAPVVRLDGVSLRYGKTVALDDITLAIPASCMVGLIGPGRRRQVQPAGAAFRRAQAAAG